MKYKILISVISILALVGTFFYFKQNTAGEEVLEAQENSIVLVVSAQNSQEKIMVEKVTMFETGWVATRAIDGNRLSQIIEISRYLEKGEHSSIQIPLGEFYNGNDNDQPFKDVNGNMTARYVKTGEVVPKNVEVSIVEARK